MATFIAKGPPLYYHNILLSRYHPFNPDLWHSSAVRNDEVEKECLGFTFVDCVCLFIQPPLECTCFADAHMVRHPLVMASESSLRHSGTAEVAASIGVHVGEDSSYNVSELLPRSAEYPTSTLAELSAALRGLKVAAEIKKGDELARLENGRTGDRLSVCRRRHDWRDPQVNGYLDLRGNHSLHRELFWQLEEAVIKLEMEYRVQTLFWWVPRKLSWQADALASLAFKKRVVRPLLADRKPKREEDGGEGSDSLNEPQRDASIPDPGAVLPPSPPPPPPYCPPASQAPAPLAWGQQWVGWPPIHLRPQAPIPQPPYCPPGPLPPAPLHGGQQRSVRPPTPLRPMNTHPTAAGGSIRWLRIRPLDCREASSST